MSLDSIVSDRIRRIMDPQSLKNFARWRISFKKILRENSLEEEFNKRVGMGCDATDLEWSVFWVAESQDRANEPPDDMRKFFRVLEGVLVLSRRLTEEIEMLCTLAMRNDEQILPGYLRLFVDRGGYESFVYQAPAILHRLRRDLEIVQLASGGKHPKLGPAKLVTAAEILFVAYIREATRKNIGLQYGSLLSMACAAYGVEARGYDEEAMTRRHNRYKHERPRDVAHIAYLAKVYVAAKVFPESIGLIPYYLEARVEWMHKERIRQLRSQGQN